MPLHGADFRRKQPFNMPLLFAFHSLSLDAIPSFIWRVQIFLTQLVHTKLNNSESLINLIKTFFSGWIFPPLVGFLFQVLVIKVVFKKSLSKNPVQTLI